MAFSPADAKVQPPRLTVSKLRREYPAGEGTLVVLKDIDLTIEPGEMVAIVGQSGSGKSTLMNILGCLDRPTAGVYEVGGKATARMEPDELAELRREHFGFIFQRYHLLGDLTAHGNVEVPAIYSGVPRDKRRERARDLLKRLGLDARMDHRPGQLSGGQQQRVSIARSLMNGGEIVLADEPTGALDTASGEEVMRILKGLHRDGHTVIIVTHDMHVAEHCERIIEIRDGNIIADRPGRSEGQVAEQSLPPINHKGGHSDIMDGFREALAMALLAMNAHRMRTFLTMLGIIIGIASVVCVVALGEGSRQAVLKQIASIGTNTLQIQPGNGFGDRRAGAIRTLVVADANALSKLSYVDSVTPTVTTNQTVRYRSISASATINGVGEQYSRVRGLQIAQGSFFTPEAVANYEQNAVIDPNTVKTFFPDGEDPIGKIIILGSVPVRVIGVSAPSSGGGGFGGNDQLNIYMPYTSVNARMLGSSVLRSLTVRIKDDTDSETAQAGVTALLTARHGTQDFFVLNTDQIRQTITATTTTLTILISAIAIISLVVGGIGVMNIMLVSVTERTQEIGVRMAVGARQRDIMQQFLIESVLVCLMGGILGIATALGFGALFAVVAKDFQMIYSITSIVAAFLCSTLIGVIFGFLPARNAARLDPVAALSRD